MEAAEKKELTEKEQELEDLKEMAWNVKRVPMYAKEEIIRLISGETNIRKDVIDGINTYKEDIKKTWPKKLQDEVFKRLKEIGWT